jgi:hypothetical protein
MNLNRLGDGAQIGERGQKYGLQMTGPGAKRPGGPGAARGAPAAKKPVASVFGGDSDEEEGIEAQIARQADSKRAAAKVGAGEVERGP